MDIQIVQADCLEWLRSQPDDCVDLILGSPPYESARTYGIGFNLRGQVWVDWMKERVLEMIRVSRGLVAMVVQGQTRQFRFSCSPQLLMADLHRAGVHLRCPPIFHRRTMPGGGGPDWLRNDYDLVVCASKGGRLSWSDNTAMGQPPKYPPGGRPSHRRRNGDRVSGRVYNPPEIANPGNVITCTVGGGHMGNDLAHKNEAPFPEALAEFFVRSYCPPEGIVLDPFCGSGTTGAAALAAGRRFIGVDIRESQCSLTARRLASVAVGNVA